MIRVPWAREPRVPASGVTRPRRARRPWFRQPRPLVVAVALAMAFPGCVAVARAELARTDTQMRTLRDAVLGEDATRTRPESRPSSGALSVLSQKRVGGQAHVARTPEQVLQDLATGAVSAGIDPPVCVTPDRPPVTLSQIVGAVYACDVTRHRWLPFGWIRVTPVSMDPEKGPRSVVSYGFGPERGSILHEFGDAPRHTLGAATTGVRDEQ